MKPDDRNLHPIGVIHSPHKEAVGTPVQASLAVGIESMVEVFPQFTAGLKDLEGFDRIWLVYWFDRAKETQLIVTPYLDAAPHGLFATRAPCRPNPIGLSAVRLLEVRGNLLRVDGGDVLDDTPLLDIKPYIPSFDAFPAQRIGWYDNAKSNSIVADSRFEAKQSPIALGKWKMVVSSRRNSAGRYTLKHSFKKRFELFGYYPN